MLLSVSQKTALATIAEKLWPGKIFTLAYPRIRLGATTIVLHAMIGHRGCLYFGQSKRYACHVAGYFADMLSDIPNVVLEQANTQHVQYHMINAPDISLHADFLSFEQLADARTGIVIDFVVCDPVFSTEIFQSVVETYSRPETSILMIMLLHTAELQQLFTKLCLVEPFYLM